MKHNLKINKNIWYASSMILLLTFVFTFVATVSPAHAGVNAEKSVSQTAISNYLAAQANPALSDQQKIKAAIDAYFTARYEGQKLLKTQNFSVLLKDTSLPWVKKENDKRQIELYIAKLFGLKYLSYAYQLKYEAISIQKNQAVIQLRESHQVVFEATTPTVSKMANLLHSIALYNRNGSWVISTDEYQDDLSSELNHMTKADILKKVDSNYQAQFQQHQATPEFQPKVNPFLASHAYNRSAAYTYAEKWATVLVNPNYPRVSAGDCTSFVSQAMYAGMGFTPPNMAGMGTLGSNSQWYFNYTTPTDFTSPWAGVPSQFTFLTRTDTTRKGPYGTESYSYCAVQWGDVVQIIDPAAPGNNTWNHEAIVVHAGNPCTALSSKTIDAHDNDHMDYPLSNWAGYTLHFILIQGWYGN